MGLSAQSVEAGTRIINSKGANERLVTSTKRVYKGKVQTWSDKSTNSKLYQHFEVAADDASGNTLTWLEACNWETQEGTLPAIATGCAAYSEAGSDSEKGKWRVPTQRELMLIWVYEKALSSQSGNGYTPLSGTQNYCSATQAPTPGSIFCLKANGTMESNSKTKPVYTVRCIRDL